VPYEERSNGSETSKRLAEMILARVQGHAERSKLFQQESQQQNRTMFNPPMPELDQQQVPGAPPTPPAGGAVR